MVAKNVVPISPRYVIPMLKSSDHWCLQMPEAERQWKTPATSGTVHKDYTGLLTSVYSP